MLDLMFDEQLMDRRGHSKSPAYIAIKEVWTLSLFLTRRIFSGHHIEIQKINPWLENAFPIESETNTMSDVKRKECFPCHQRSPSDGVWCTLWTLVTAEVCPVWLSVDDWRGHDWKQVFSWNSLRDQLFWWFCPTRRLLNQSPWPIYDCSPTHTKIPAILTDRQRGRDWTKCSWKMIIKCHSDESCESKKGGWRLTINAPCSVTSGLFWYIHAVRSDLFHWKSP